MVASRFIEELLNDLSYTSGTCYKEFGSWARSSDLLAASFW
jgi:hypothetical protein